MTPRPPALGELDPDAHLRDPARKQHYVTTLFDTVAPSYDLFTRWFSAGADARWKRLLARWAAEGLRPGDLVADLACGTGDLLTAVRRTGGAAVMLVGLDPSRGMLARAADLVRAESVRLVRADMLALPLPAGSAAAVTVGYGFRNVPDLPRALSEAWRVLRPGGRVVSLDFFLPESRPWRRLYRWYVRHAGRLVGRWWHGEPEAYGYIDRSLEGWCTPAEFGGAIERAGFVVERVARRLGGGICLHQARRTENS
jgi:demethylmenaquinone methyltransferase/2-methoxy-6-polyprenyl-1,4-benzoquinol methylase